MPPSKNYQLRSLLKWVFWVLLVQLVLANISAALYAYKFTNFCRGDAPAAPSSPNIFVKTWQLFAGPRFYKPTDEPQPVFAHETVELSLKGGRKIHAWYSAADTSRPCVILLHGVMSNKSYLLQEAGFLRAWGYNILLLDFRAHGQSEGYSHSFGYNETEEVEQAVRYVRSRGVGRFILYGLSMGSVVALKAAAEKKVAPMAIVADMPFGSLHRHLGSRARVLGFPSEPFSTLVTFWIGLERGFNGFRYRADQYAAAVPCPVLLQWGSQDPFVQQAETEAIYRQLPSRKKLAVYPGAGHESFLLHDPVRWQREVGGFLSAL